MVKFEKNGLNLPILFTCYFLYVWYAFSGALDLEKGDEVILPAFTWVSTANVIEHQEPPISATST